MNMLVSYEPFAGATYVRFSQQAFDHSVSVGDLVVVNVAADGEPIGVDFAVAPAKITESMIDRVIDRFPSLKDLADTDAWLFTHA